MKKKLIIVLILLVIFTISACENKTDDPVDNDIITIEMSDEAKKYAETDLIADGGDKIYLQQEMYDQIIDYRLSNPVEQVLPECDVENQIDCYEYEENNIYTLTPESYDKIILYIHGGGWVFEISEGHVALCDKLASRLNAKVYMPLYPLAPEYNSEDTFSFIEDVYKSLLDLNLPIYIMGDSAGGEITLGLMYTIKQEELIKPDKIIVMAPCSDMSLTNEEIYEIEDTDPVLAVYGAITGAKLWAGEDNLKNPKYSAVYADVTDYPDTMIIQGTNDILCPDNLILYEHLKQAGVNVKLVKGIGLWHVFAAYPIPERDTCIDLIEEFCAN